MSNCYMEVEFPSSMTEQEAEQLWKSKVDQAVSYAVTRFLADNGYLPLACHVDITYRQYERWKEVIVTVTETRRARFEKT